jgi:hypothetical protein
MNQMAESIAMLKKNFENIEKVLKNVEKKLEMNYLQVQNQFSEIMQDTNMKINQMLKNIAYLTQVTENGRSSLETRQGEPVIVEATDAGRVHIQELYHDQARNIGVHIEEVDILGSSNEEDRWPKKGNLDSTSSLLWFQRAEKAVECWSSGSCFLWGNAWSKDSKFQYAESSSCCTSVGHKFFHDDRVPKGEHLAEDPFAIITRSVKADFPKFDGFDPSSWIYKANKFLYYHRTPYNKKLLLASIHMEGKALVSYQDMDLSGYLPNWIVLT